MAGIIGKKVGMSSVYDEAGKLTACTLIEAGPCVVTQVKSMENDGYEAVQVAFGERKEKNVTAPMQGHFKKAGTSPKHKVVEFKNWPKEMEVGEEYTIDTLFEEGQFVAVTGTSKGKGFAGVVKRHGFAGVGGQTHGQHNRERAPGSLGAGSYPSRVWKGQRMAGRMGGDRVTVENLQIVKMFADKNLIAVKGSVPGSKDSYVLIWK